MAVTYFLLLETVVGNKKETESLQQEENNIGPKDKIQAHLEIVLAYVTATSHDEQEHDKAGNHPLVGNISRLNLIVNELVSRHLIPDNAHVILEVELKLARLHPLIPALLLHVSLPLFELFQFA